MKTQFLAFLSFVAVLSADAATVQKAPLKSLLIDNASVVTDVTDFGSATRLETADGRTWIDAAGDVRQVQRKAVFNGMEAVSGDDPAGGAVAWMFYDRGPEGGYCQLTYDAGRWNLTLERLEDVDVDENGDVRQEIVQRTWSATAPWNSSTVTLNGDWGTETVQLSFVTGIVNRVAFTNDVPKVDLSGLPILTTNDVCAIVTNEVVGGWMYESDCPGLDLTKLEMRWSPYGEDMPGWCLFYKGEHISGSPKGKITDTVFVVQNDWMYGPTYKCTATCGPFRNALGLAMAKDVEQITNAIPAIVTNVIPSIVTNTLPGGWSEWRKNPGWKDPPDTQNAELVHAWDNVWDFRYEDYWNGEWIASVGNYVEIDEGQTRVDAFTGCWFEREWIPGGNALGLATMKDLEGISPTVPPSITNDIEKLKTESTLVYRLFSGSNIVMEVTNYNSRVNPPAMKLMRLNDKGIYEVMWTETNGLERTYNRAASNTAEKVAALEKKAAETYAPRGWSATTSGLGADAPKDTTWISTPTTVIAGGLEYSKVVTSSGQLWFLRSNGMVANVGGNSGGYFDISASDGTSVFSIEKTDSYMAPVDADGMSVNGNTVTIRLSVVSADHPFLRYAPTLKAPVVWQKEEDGFSSPITVSWSGSSGAWVATVTTTAKAGFFQFEFFQEGGTKIKSGGAMDVSTGGILCTDGIHKCRPVYNSNGTITWEAF